MSNFVSLQGDIINVDTIVRITKIKQNSNHHTHAQKHWFAIKLLDDSIIEYDLDDIKLTDSENEEIYMASTLGKEVGELVNIYLQEGLSRKRNMIIKIIKAGGNLICIGCGGREFDKNNKCTYCGT